LSRVSAAAPKRDTLNELRTPLLVPRAEARVRARKERGIRLPNLRLRIPEIVLDLQERRVVPMGRRDSVFKGQRSSASRGRQLLTERDLARERQERDEPQRTHIGLSFLEREMNQVAEMATLVFGTSVPQRRSRNTLRENDV
jgi:hypothetical protein